jgi:hypothetical protein
MRWSPPDSGVKPVTAADDYESFFLTSSEA